MHAEPPRPRPRPKPSNRGDDRTRIASNQVLQTRQGDVSAEEAASSPSARRPPRETKSRANPRHNPRPHTGPAASAGIQPPVEFKGPITLLKRGSTPATDEAGTVQSAEHTRASELKNESSIEPLDSKLKNNSYLQDALMNAGIYSDEGSSGQSAGLIKLPEEGLHGPKKSKQKPWTTSPQNNRGSRPRGAALQPRQGGRGRSHNHAPQQNHTYVPRLYDWDDELFGRSERSGDGHSHQLFDPRKHDALSFSRESATGPGSGAGHDSRASGRFNLQSLSGDGLSRSELDAVYQELCRLEVKLRNQYEDQERSRKHAGSRNLLRPATSTSPGRSTGAKYDVKQVLSLRQDHIALVNIHHTFIYQSMIPSRPAPVQRLPLEYSLPQRLWMTGFDAFIKYLNQFLGDASSATSCKDDELSDGKKEIIEHLRDFFAFGYNFYAALSEARHLEMFRSSWAEALGNLAKVRIDLVPRVPPDDLASAFERLNLAKPIEPSSSADAASPALAHRSAWDTSQVPSDQPQEASIGKHAMDAWELDEAAIWRETAADWYKEALSDQPGSGQLHIDFATQAKLPALRNAYHLCKASSASTRQSVANQVFLDAFERADLELSDAEGAAASPSWSSVRKFLRLHASLLRGQPNESFDEDLESFVSQLEADRQRVDQALCPDSILAMMAIINITMLLRAGGRRDLLMESGSTDKVGEDGDKDTGEAESSDITAATGPHDGHATGTSQVLDGYLKLAFHPLRSLLDESKRLEGNARTEAKGFTSYELIMLVFLYRLCQSSTANGREPFPLSILRAQMPWASLAKLTTDERCRLPSVNTVSTLPPLYLSIPEDMCLRGLDWVDDHVFKTRQDSLPAPGSGDSTPTGPSASRFSKRGQHTVQQHLSVGNHSRGAPLPAPSEMAVLERSPPVKATAWDEPDETLAKEGRAKWKRVAFVLAGLAQVVPGFDRVTVTTEAGDKRQMIEVREPLLSAVARDVFP